jgi:hypothetical protein
MKKTKIKIGLSLIVAIFFILPSGVLAGIEEAGDKNNDANIDNDLGFKRRIDPNNPIAQQQCIVLPMGLYDPDFGYIFDGSAIPEGVYDLWTEIYVEPGCGPTEIKAFLEVYKKCCGEEIIMYETGFEDNFDIYNNWIQIDQDCGMTSQGPGHYDSWTHSDARSSPADGGDYSFKCSMYDIYKGNQDDFFRCTRYFDISDQQGVNVSFDCYVDGSAATLWAPGGQRVYTPFDYLDFEISDRLNGEGFGYWVNPDNYMNFLAMEQPPAAFHDDQMRFLDSAPGYWLEGAYRFFDTRISLWDASPYRDYTPKCKDIGGGWWHVWFEISEQELWNYGFNTEEIMFQFSWHSDPEVQFEGAYVDNFKVVSIEDCENKIFQTHTQGPVVLDPGYEPEECYFYVDFPLDWNAINLQECGQKTTWYDFRLWIEVLDEQHYTPYSLDNDPPDWVDIAVEVGDFYDCHVIDAWIETSFGQDIVIPPFSLPGTEGEMSAGEDMHLTATVHLRGTTPAEDVPVKATAFKKSWETIYETDFESGTGGWSFWTWSDYPSMWHHTDLDAWSGTKSIGCFDKDTQHYKNNNDGDVAEYGQTYMVDEWMELEVDFYAKWIFADSDDNWRPMVMDPATNYAFGVLAGPIGDSMPRTGYYNEWYGPNQPQCIYRNLDLIYWYDYWYNVRGFYRNPDGSQSFEIGFAFCVWETGPDGYVHPQASLDEVYWSGLMIDDVTVRGMKAEDVVWTDTIIIPEMEVCELYDVQFEWEDVPYSYYLIRVECDPDGGCDNWESDPWERQILVTGDKEIMHPKEVEQIDLTGFGEGEWGISTSDTDYYLATNTDLLYDGDSNQVAKLCPNHEGDCSGEVGDPCCLDLTYAIANGLPVLMDATLWWDVEGGAEAWGPDWMFDYAFLEYAIGCPADKETDWNELICFGDWFWGTVAHPCLPESSYYYTGWPGFGEEETDGWVTLSGIEQGIYSGQFFGDAPPDLSSYSNAICDPGTGMVDLLALLPPGETHLQLRWRLETDAYGNFRGVKIDDMTITNLFGVGFPIPQPVDFFDDMDNMSNWCVSNLNVGSYWFHLGEFFPADTGTYCNFFDENLDGIKDPTESTQPNMNDALIWTTEIEDAYEAYLHFETDYQFEDGDIGFVEIDDGTGKWWILEKFEGSSGGWISNNHPDISFLAGKVIQVRFRLVTDGDAPVDCDHWCIRDVHITGKQDHSAPTSSITMTGTMKDSGWYNTAVNVKITATDNVEVAEIHYILDGQETVVSGDTAEFTVTGNGPHNIEFWAVDLLGNAEAHNTVPTFRIDMGSPPSVSITAPEPGLYLFGNKILSASKVIIIGAFTIEATASDADSGVYKVQFFLDGDIIGEDTEVPYSAYCAVKHMGDGTIRVVAEDFAQNTAEDTLDVTYYKFL